jgi:uncharacterized zinc-type alcohol dehydrogenase-like protein
MIHAYAVLGAKQPLKPFEYKEANLGEKEVEIKITHCGLCHSDVHLIDDDWLISKYPLVPGHEIIGTILRKGKDVQGLEEGSRVGVGWQAGSCFKCECCQEGEESLCSQKKRTCVDMFGGFADKIVVDSRYTYKIPQELDSVSAAPLLCAGITVFAPLKIYDVKKGMSVAVIGIGGLGHLALQFAKAIGCTVTAISTTLDKEVESKRLGASHFLSLKDREGLKKVASSFDFILSTVHVDLDWNLIVSLLKPKGRLCLVGIPPSDLKIAARLLISGNRSICGNSTGNRKLMAEMLAFAAQHKIAAQTETLPMSEVNQAIARLKSNQVRYRMVLVN